MRKLTALLIIALSVPALLFAGGNPQSQSSSTSGAINLRYAWFGNVPIDTATNEVIPVYQQEHPGVTILPETASWTGYWDKLNTQAAARTLPDLIQHDYSMILQWVERGLMHSLDEYIADGTIDTSNIADSIIEGGRINGKIYSISTGSNAYGMIVDTGVLAQAGITIDSAKWTYDDFKNYATQIYQRTGKKTMPFTGAWQFLCNMAKQLGGSFFAADGKSLDFTDTSIVRQFFQVQLDLLDAGVLYNPEEGLMTVSVDESPFAQGLVWNDYYWSNQLGSMALAANRDIDMVLLPNIANSKRPGTWLKPTLLYTIAASSANPKAAAEFMNFLLTNPKGALPFASSRGIPIPSDIQAQVKASADAITQKEFAYIELATANSSPIDPPDPPAAGEIQTYLGDLNSEVLTRTKTVDQAVSEFFSHINSTLNQ